MDLLQSSPVTTPSTLGPTLLFRPAPYPSPKPSAGPAGGVAAGVGTVSAAAAAPGSVGAEVYRRRRLVAVAVALGLVLGLLSVGRPAGANRTPEAEAAEAITVVVKPGDTLWDIARSLAPGDDPRPLADALSDLADGTTLQPGQHIVVPASLVD